MTINAITTLCAAISSPDSALLPAIRHAIDHKTKPLGALGQLERVAEQLCLIQQSLQPQIRRPQMAVFAADHGVAAEGVSAFPQAVTAQMVHNFLAGGAAINCFCSTLGWQLAVVNAGVAVPLPKHQALIERAVVSGTANLAVEAALTPTQCDSGLLAGAALADGWADTGSNLLSCGEMGIANTTTAAALLAALTGWSAVTWPISKHLETVNAANRPLEVLRLRLDDRRPPAAPAPVLVVRPPGVPASTGFRTRQ